MTGDRFARQTILPEIGESGQRRLKESSVLVVGCGGLGSALLYCLCGMGVGRVGFADGDLVSASDLNRQFLHAARDVGRKKTLSAYEKLHAFAPEVNLDPYPFFLTTENAAAIVPTFDVVALAVDSVEARLRLNRVCVEANVPLADGGVDGFCGRAIAVKPHESACLCCLFGEKPKIGDAEEAPIASFAPIVTLVSAEEALLVSQILLGFGESPYGKLHFFDGTSFSARTTRLAKNPACPVCGKA